MNFADTLRGLWRRWYIVLPGILLAVALANGAWYAVPAGYERSSTQLLVPGGQSMPEGANPYLFLGGLSPAADVLVRAVGSENVLNEVISQYPGARIEISRDSSAGPVLLIVVTAASDADAKEVVELMVARTATVLEDLQEAENVAGGNRVSVLPVTIDSQSTVNLRSRIIAMSAAGIAGLALTLFVAGLVDGYSLKRKRREGVGAQHKGEHTSTLPSEDSVEDYAPAHTGVRPVQRNEESAASDQSRFDDELETAASPTPSAR